MERVKAELLPSERLDDLLTHELHIIQSPEVFSFSMDAVLLARFASVPRKGQILDLCTGNGVIPLLLSTRTQARIDAVEIQPRLADMARRSVQWNGLEEQIRIVQGDLRSYHLEQGYGVYDLVTVNPPYMPASTGDQNSNEHMAIARHEIHCTLQEVAAACSRLVRTGGKVAMVHRPSRLAEIIDAMRAVRLEPKRLRMVHPHAEAEANMVLIEASRDGKPELRVLPPLIVYDANHRYQQELMEIYYGQVSQEG
ncbi:tRNA1(Val) (adenine(37)-N6)-methyltransferase [Paenibacillus sp. SYP-B4298]|uniref:tRNA1(Val) (adenine(37)-N6)-methyltransferase n=1 Tax=Paenibacillus sp. SYP-B4298 TaxID=2996034 RepID=UPI0022DD4B47|nr:tRNA1(Val) (adenine(37)-N6)-methyltransferase [Paenibacillus sp. SYP-B4298]